MGSIPVAGAKKTSATGGGLFGIRTANPSVQAKRSGIGFAYPARRSTSSLVRRRVRVYSPKAKFPFDE